MCMHVAVCVCLPGAVPPELSFPSAAWPHGRLSDSGHPSEFAPWSPDPKLTIKQNSVVNTLCPLIHSEINYISKAAVLHVLSPQPPPLYLFLLLSLGQCGLQRLQVCLQLSQFPLQLPPLAMEGGCVAFLFLQALTQILRHRTVGPLSKMSYYQISHIYKCYGSCATCYLQWLLHLDLLVHQLGAALLSITQCVLLLWGDKVSSCFYNYNCLHFKDIT